MKFKFSVLLLALLAIRVSTLAQAGKPPAGSPTPPSWNPRGTADIWYYHALGNFQLHKPEVAETSANKSLAMERLHTQSNSEQLLAVILAQKQDFAGALQHLRNCLTYFQPGPNLDLVKQQIAQIEPLVPTAK